MTITKIAFVVIILIGAYYASTMSTMSTMFQSSPAVEYCMSHIEQNVVETDKAHTREMALSLGLGATIPLYQDDDGHGGGYGYLRDMCKKMTAPEITRKYEKALEQGEMEKLEREMDKHIIMTMVDQCKARGPYMGCLIYDCAPHSATRSRIRECK
jgi:hypothetical protein